MSPTYALLYIYNRETSSGTCIKPLESVNIGGKYHENYNLKFYLSAILLNLTSNSFLIIFFKKIFVII
jgi:hypothetical protein